jgi:hypothetical protein
MSSNLASPIIVVSPALRAGTTLVQRLLCSAGNTLVFGDAVGQEMEFFAKYAAVKAQVLPFHDSTSMGLKEAVLGGDTTDFIAQLSVSSERHLAGLRAAALAWLQECLDEAIAAGRPVWGWKTAGTDPVALRLLAQWFPQARWIWVQRDVADCFRSAKAAGMVLGAVDARRFVQQATDAAAAFAPLVSQALMLDYTAMLEDPAGTIQRLEAWTGAVGIDPTVFSVRVNQPGQAVCTPPAVLDPEEAAVFSQAAGPTVLPNLAA